MSAMKTPSRSATTSRVGQPLSTVATAVLAAGGTSTATTATLGLLHAAVGAVLIAGLRRRVVGRAA